MATRRSSASACASDRLSVRRESRRIACRPFVAKARNATGAGAYSAASVKTAHRRAAAGPTFPPVAPALRDNTTYATASRSMFPEEGARGERALREQFHAPPPRRGRSRRSSRLGLCCVGGWRGRGRGSSSTRRRAQRPARPLCSPGPPPRSQRGHRRTSFLRTSRLRRCSNRYESECDRQREGGGDGTRGKALIEARGRRSHAAGGQAREYLTELLG
eukprot:1192912-Prorocentrum_minimum.AAC.6